MCHIHFQLPIKSIIVIGSNTSNNGQSHFTEDVHASLKMSRSFWNSDRIGRSLERSAKNEVLEDMWLRYTPMYIDIAGIDLLKSTPVISMYI